MNTNFAQRAKDIVAKHGKDKKSALAELDQLRREQFNHEQQLANGGKVNIDKEIDRGIEVEREHAPTLQFTKDYFEQTGQFPTVDKFAKSIMVDHEKDFKNVSDNPERSYYKSLINNGLSDELSKYANGGSIKPLNIPDEQLETIRMMADGGPIGKLINNVGTPNQNYIDSISNVAKTNQYDMTQQFKTAHPNVPIDQILAGFDADKNFRNSNLDQKADSLTNIYGDLSIPTTDAYQKTAREYSNLTNIQGGMDFNRTGVKEDGTKTPAFGWRAMGMKYPHPQGTTAYPTPAIKSVGGPINGGNLFNQGSVSYASGGYKPKVKNDFASQFEDMTNNLPEITRPNPWSGAYGQGVTVPQDSIKSYVGKYFKTPEDQQRMLGIIQRESAGTNAFRDKSKNPGGGNDWGLSQINDKYHPNYFTGNYDMTNPEQNIKAASEIAYGSKNGWSAWNASSKYDASGAPKTTDPIKPYSHPIGVAPELMKSSAERYGIPPIAGLQPSLNPSQPSPVDPQSFDYNNAMRYAPIAMNALSALTAKKGRSLDSVNLPTISPTLISPEQLSTAPVQEAVGSQYRSSVDALSGATGGSGASVRSGLSSLSLAGSRGAGEAYNDIYSKNAMLRGDVTKYNAQETSQTNRVNLDQANREAQINRESQIANQQDRSARDMYRLAGLNAAATGIGQVGKENKQAEMIRNIYGYDAQGNKISLEDAKKKLQVIKGKTSADIAKNLKKAEKYTLKNPVIKSLNPQAQLNKIKNLSSLLGDNASY